MNVVVAGFADWSHLSDGEFVGSAVLAAGLHEDEWAVVYGEVIGEEGRGIGEFLRKIAPQTATADF